MENSHSCLDHDIDTNELQCLNLCENLDDIGPFNSEIDPDQNLLTDSKLKCAYYTFQSFDAYLLETLPKETLNLTLLCVNIRSAPRNLEKLDMLIDQCIFKPRVIGITETWLNESNQDLYHLNNYNSVNSVRTNKKGGGVSLMVKFGITYESIPSMTLSKKHIECVFIKVEKFSICSLYDVIIGIVYRPPNGDIPLFLDEMNRLLESRQAATSKLYVMGDFNINLLNKDKVPFVANFLNLMYSHCLVPLISRPTRLTDHSCTLIDNIFTNCIGMNHTSAVMLEDLSDHCPIISINLEIATKTKEEFRRYRQTKKANIDMFVNKMRKCNWNDVLTASDVQSAYTLLHDKLTNDYEECFPVIVEKKSYKNRYPWINHTLRHSIKQKNKMYISLRKHYSCEKNEKYKTYKRTLDKILKQAAFVCIWVDALMGMWIHTDIWV